MPTVSEILNSLMVRERLTDNELAARTGVPQPTISRIRSGESRDPRDSTLRQLADYFRLTVSQLRGDVPLPVDRVTVTADDQVVEVSMEVLRLAQVIESLPSEERGALQTLVDALTHPKDCSGEEALKVGRK
ncbi:MAG: helix-turn-helix transcriptional regulator [Candidatus Contendobacter sp.]|nr:helix-turn-helix transcriptional regulator [Candidatus Contendobacter sp.]MDG4558847.1 helix-turn-helix transcriptional regulator [Candidatus Contendobacter sp.]